MSSKLPPIDLTSKAVGFVGTMSFLPFVKFSPTNLQVKGKLRLLNESGCGLDIVFKSSGNYHFLPAGGWGTFDVEPNDGNITATVTYVLPNPPVSTLNGIYFAPGEPVPDSFTLGNSPIGIGGTISVTNVSNLSNEGAAANTEVVDIGTSTIAKLVDIFNDHFIWSVQQAGVAHQVLKGQTAGNPLQLGQTGDTTEVLGTLAIDQNASITGNLTGTVNANGTLNATGAGTAFTVTNNATIGGTLQGTGIVTLLNLLKLNASSQVLNGSTTGTLTTWQAIAGSSLNIVLMFMNNFRNNGGSTQGVALTVPFTGRQKLLIGNVPSNGFSVQASGVSQGVAIQTTLPTAGGASGIFTNFTVVTTGNAMGEVLSGWDTLIIPSGGVAGTTGFFMFIGV